MNTNSPTDSPKSAIGRLTQERKQIGRWDNEGGTLAASARDDQPPSFHCLKLTAHDRETAAALGRSVRLSQVHTPRAEE